MDNLQYSDLLDTILTTFFEGFGNTKISESINFESSIETIIGVPHSSLPFL
jgi:hypothetical protein